MNTIISTQLKQHLKKLSSADLLKDIVSLFQKYADVKEYYQITLSSSGNLELCEQYKMKIKNEFFPVRGLGKMRLSIARKAVVDFKRMSTDVHCVADIMVYYVEMGINFTKEYGDIDEPFYNSMESMYEEAAKFVTKNKIANEYAGRFWKMVDDTVDMGWGFNEGLESIFEKYFQKILGTAFNATR